jgi:predicted acylesterase/phospholipase RssA
VTELDPVRNALLDPDGLVRAERDHDRVVLTCPDDATADWRSFCLRQADTVVLVSRSDLAPPASLDPRPARRPEVVLVGPTPSPAERAAWAAAVDAWQLTLVADGDLRSGLRDLGDRLAGTALGVVIGGGGARSLAGIGVVRELEDAGLRVSRVSGTSMGGILGAVHALGLDGEAMEDAAYAGLVVGRPFSDFALSPTSLSKGERVRTMLVRTLGADTVIEGLPRQLAVVSTDLVSRTRQVHRRGNLVEAVAATCRLPILLPPMPQQDGRLLVDGGVIDNLPTDLLVERAEGPVVAVAIGGGGGEGPRREGPPRVPALADTLMRTLMMQSGGAVEAARELGAWVVAPPSLGVGLLEFHQFDRVVESGRRAVRDLLEQTGGDLRRPVADADLVGR